MRHPSRRDFLKAASIGAAATALPLTLIGSGQAQAPQASATPKSLKKPPVEALKPAASAPVLGSAPAPWQWIAPLKAGDHLGRGWVLESLSAVEQGRVEIGLRHAQAGAAVVHVYRRVGAPRGIAHTGELDLLLMNGAGGSTPSDESLGLTIMALARGIERNERTGMVADTTLAVMTPHARQPTAS